VAASTVSSHNGFYHCLLSALHAIQEYAVALGGVFP